MFVAVFNFQDFAFIKIRTEYYFKDSTQCPF